MSINLPFDSEHDFFAVSLCPDQIYREFACYNHKKTMDVILVSSRCRTVDYIDKLNFVIEDPSESLFQKGCEWNAC